MMFSNRDYVSRETVDRLLAHKSDRWDLDALRYKVVALDSVLPQEVQTLRDKVEELTQRLDRMLEAGRG